MAVACAQFLCACYPLCSALDGAYHPSVSNSMASLLFHKLSSIVVSAAPLYVIGYACQHYNLRNIICYYYYYCHHRCCSAGLVSPELELPLAASQYREVHGHVMRHRYGFACTLCLLGMHYVCASNAIATALLPQHSILAMYALPSCSAMCL